MSDKIAAPNRREAMKMIGATTLGAVGVGFSTYVATRQFNEAVAERDAKEIYESGQFDLTKEQILSIIKPIYDKDANKTSVFAAALGGLVGNVYYDWDTPDTYDFDY